MTKYKIQISSKFKNQLKKLSQKDKNLTKKVVDILTSGEKLDKKYLDHKLKNDFKDYRECHIKPDLLLVYRYFDDKLLLYLYQIGSHSEIF
ncbi:type II toxin-antitoxin system YafQ family toxin [Campylobacter ureolyticus]|uniref:Type II toxin-antitoxin system YafQ family toxin n=1 Tax=Campylobacter ureolyticus TaxID=827 RepID=A0A2I1NBX9_9BACT|nr:type II toxin-antitoxin system YafQ family toxin [Campylobacter ureolyticus]MCZ6103318.1 type II toxin-antitoxin system YafQ family toxin [Campylobacter ureolyticus]MCZ6134518.1 type II toxin-antitoxin system YafQ family toxin [Campylobacter ureolyticus]MCZ6159491.1 type II toxin-antitoxin system YafQ family toxin [Campylobacter ureolyticus]MCZ6160954.1 type II toxin-antitoxin system YafQ family toxin [Campylobacter ureolyticus]MCZ6163604.1 type II toxin-antitoxin system YafQ family toxin [